jgi:rhodanese-related sulfurtransferase/DNA-binding MarR family transcriptional regulator
LTARSNSLAGGDSAKSALYQQLARVAQALGSPGRLQILEYVAQGERSVDALASMCGLSVANTSKHLQALRQAGLVTARKEGLRVYYLLAGDDVVALISALRAVAEHRVADMERLVRLWFAHRDEMEPVPAAELLARAKKGLVTVLDVRPAEEYAAAHIPGAISVPLDKLESYLSRLPKRKEVVAYCRGPYCLMSFEAVARLRKRGWRARRLENGLPEWRAAGFPVVREGETASPKGR